MNSTTQIRCECFPHRSTIPPTELPTTFGGHSHLTYAHIFIFYHLNSLEKVWGASAIGASGTFTNSAICRCREGGRLLRRENYKNWMNRIEWMRHWFLFWLTFMELRFLPPFYDVSAYLHLLLFLFFYFFIVVQLFDQ